MTGPVLRFRVPGTPVPQGSKSGWVLGKRAVLHDDNAKVLKPWRKAVTAAAAAALPAGWEPLGGPLRVSVVLGFTRPASYPKRVRRWPIAKNSTGDVDKLARAVLDACTVARVWGDDAQVIALLAEKDYCGFGPAGVLTLPGAIVRIWQMTAEEPRTDQLSLLTEQDPA